MTKRRGVRVAFIVFAATTLLVALTVFLLYLGVRPALARAALEVQRDAHAAFLGWAVVLVLGAAVLAAWAGGRISARLQHLESVLLVRSGGDGGHPLPGTRIAELRRLGHAIDRIGSELRSHAARLERERQQLALLVDSVSDGLIRLDERGRLMFANPAARRLLALPERAVGQPLAVLVRDVELRALAERALAGAVDAGAEITLGERRMLASAQPLQDAGEERGAVLALADLTELRRLEGVRRDFVANVSHELKTPLTSIRGYLETVLADDGVPADTRRQFLEVASRNAERLQRIVDELLDLSRIESGGWRPEAQPLHAAELVRDVWVGCEARASRQAVAFIPPAADAEVLADPGALRQVLGNLFDNALCYTPAGGSIEVRIIREAMPAQGDAASVRFEVRDTGAGIPREALPRIFERFYRVDPARSRAGGGTGLGLAIVKHLVERMGGEVSAESELGRGTIIRFRLPAA